MKLMLDEPEVTESLYDLDDYTADLDYTYQALKIFDSFQDKKAVSELVNKKLDKLASLFNAENTVKVVLSGIWDEKLLLVKTGILDEFNKTLESPLLKSNFAIYDAYVKSLEPQGSSDFKRVKLAFKPANTFNYLKHLYANFQYGVKPSILFYLNSLPLKTTDKIIGDNLDMDYLLNTDNFKSVVWFKSIRTYLANCNMTTFNRKVFLTYVRMALAFVIVKDAALSAKGLSTGKRSWIDLSISRVVENLNQIPLSKKS
jgi:hypothetical protein